MRYQTPEKKKNRLQISHDDRVNDMHFGNQENEK